MEMIKLSFEIIKDLRNLAESIETLMKAMEDREKTENGKEEDLAVTVDTKPIPIEKVRAVLAEKSRSGKQDKVKALIKKYGGVKLTDVDPACFRELLEDAEAL